MTGGVSLTFNLLARNQAAGEIRRTADATRSAGATSRAAGLAAKAGMLAAAASATAWAAAVGGALLPTIGLLPGMLTGTVGAVAGLRVATGGLGDAWKATGASMSAGGGSAESVAKRVAAAQWQVESATRTKTQAITKERAAQDALTAAWRTAADNLAGLNRQYRHSITDSDAAQQALARAAQALRQARASGTAQDIQDAAMAYRQASDAAEDAAARADELKTQTEQANAAGVAGSAEVKSAQDDLEQAQWAVVEATRALTEAQDAAAEAGKSAGGGADAAAQALAKLSPNARSVITTLRSLGTTWDTSVHRPMQQATFAGVATDLRSLSASYLPVMSGRLTELGGAYNSAIRESLRMATSKQVVADVDTTLRNTASTTRVFGQAFAPAIQGLTGVGAEGSKFLPLIAGWIRDVAQGFSDWVTKARETGALQGYLQTGYDALHNVWIIAVDVGKTIGNIFKAANAGGDGQSLLTTLREGADWLAKWSGSAEGQDKLSSAMDRARNVVSGLAQPVRDADGAVSGIKDTFSVAGVTVGFLADHIGTLSAAMPALAAGFVVYKVSQVAANAAMVAAIPLRILELTQTWGMRAALQAHTLALGQNTAAQTGSTAATAAGTATENVGILTRIRSGASWVASKAAMVAHTVASKAAAAGQWLLNAAMSANPITLIVIGILLLVGLFILLWTKCEWFRNGVMMIFGAIVDAVKWYAGVFMSFWGAIGSFISGLFSAWWGLFTGFWGAIIGGISAAVGWVKDRVGDVISWVAGVGGRIRSVASGMWDGISDAFKGMINFVIGLWNKLDFSVDISVPDWVPGVGGRSFHIGDVIPDIPLLARGGYTSTGGAAVVGDGGEPEIVDLPRGARVTPLSVARQQAAGAPGGTTGGTRVVELRSDGSELSDWIVKTLRRAVRDLGGGDVQIALGRR